MKAPLDPDRLLALLRDPNVESRDIAMEAGVSQEETSRAARLVLGIAKARPEEAVTLPPPLAAAVARAALAAGRGDLLAALSTHAGKDVSKEARRGLHLLRSRGVAVPEAGAPPVPVPAPPAEPPLPAYGSALDGQGERAVWISRNVPGRGVEIAQAILSDEKGLLELQVALLGRKEWRTVVRDLLDHGVEMGVGEIDPARAVSLVAAGRARNDAAGQRVPEGADLWLAQLGQAAPLADPAAAFPPLPEEEEQRALAASGELHALPLFRGWLADVAFLRGVAAKLDEVAASPLVLDEAQRTVQMDRVLADAVGAYLDEERRRVLSARLFAIAEHLAERGDPLHARTAAAAARALRAGTAAADIPFARILVEKAFPKEGLAPGGAGEAGPAPAPIVVPAR